MSKEKIFQKMRLLKVNYDKLYAVKASLDKKKSLKSLIYQIDINR